MMRPRTLLARTFLLLAILVLLTTAAWLSLFRYIDAEPRARETAQLAASAVNLVRASLFAAAPEKRHHCRRRASSARRAHIARSAAGRLSHNCSM